MNVSKLAAAGIIFSTAIVVIATVHSDSSSSALDQLTGTQEVRILDRRITMLEQRLYSIESSINRLEQSAISQRSPVPLPTARDQEMNLIRDDLHKLSQRLSEIECGLIRLDERTAPSVGENRRTTGGKDPCRLNPNTRLRLSTRP